MVTLSVCSVLLASLLVNADWLQASTFGDMDSLLKTVSKSNKYIRPVHNQSDSLLVSIGFSMKSFGTVDMVTGEVLVSGQLTVGWFDEFLGWNVSQYGGISRLNLPPGSIWRPSLVLADQHGTDAGLTTVPVSTTLVRSNGSVTWLSAISFRSRCTINMVTYPYDSHVCQFTLLTVEYGSNEIHLVPTSHAIGLASCVENGEWLLNSTSAKQVMLQTDDKDLVLSSVTYTISISRRPAFVMVHYFALVAILTVLNLMAPLLPVRSGERIGYCVTLYLAFIFITASTINATPRNSLRISYHSMHHLYSNLIMALGVIWSVLLVRLAHKTEEKTSMPRWLVTLTSFGLKFRRRFCGSRISETTVRAGPKRRDSDASLQYEVEEEKWKTVGDKIIKGTQITWIETAETLDILYLVVTLALALFGFVLRYLLMFLEKGSSLF